MNASAVSGYSGVHMFKRPNGEEHNSNKFYSLVIFYAVEQ